MNRKQSDSNLEYGGYSFSPKPKSFNSKNLNGELFPHPIMIEDLPNKDLLEPFLNLNANYYKNQPDRNFDDLNSFDDDEESSASPNRMLLEEEEILISPLHQIQKPFAFPVMELESMEIEEQEAEAEDGDEENQMGGQKAGPFIEDTRKNSDKKSLSKNGQTSCNCKKSKCLKLYCECFRSNGFCDPSCSCQECYNKEEYVDIRNQFYKEQLQRNPSSFSSKIIELPTIALYARGCNCKKTECMKNYCECYAAKVKCTHLCRCSECQNFDDSVTQEDLLCFQEKQVKKRKKSEKNFNECLNERLALRKGTSEVGEANMTK
jgi:hypothetical protein